MRRPVLNTVLKEFIYLCDNPLLSSENILIEGCKLCKLHLDASCTSMWQHKARGALLLRSNCLWYFQAGNQSSHCNEVGFQREISPHYFEANITSDCAALTSKGNLGNKSLRSRLELHWSSKILSWCCANSEREQLTQPAFKCPLFHTPVLYLYNCFPLILLLVATTENDPKSLVLIFCCF